MEKTVIVFSMREGEAIERTHKDIKVVTPATPVTRQMLYQFLSANYALRQLAEGMVWGHVKPEDYAALTQQFAEADAVVEKALKEARKKLTEINKERKSRKKVAQVVKAEQPKPKQTQQKPKQTAPVPAVAEPVTAAAGETARPQTGDNGGGTSEAAGKSKSKVEVI